MRDPHSALKLDELGKGRARKAGVDFILIRHQWGKNDVGVSIHAAPNSWTTSGIQTPDFLAVLGFERSSCPFTRTECFCRWVDDDFPLEPFAEHFDESFDLFTQSAGHLDSCGIYLEQLEGWGYFFGKESRGRERRTFDEFGDGHTAASHKQLKSTEDGAFQYRLVWVTTTDGDKGGQDATKEALAELPIGASQRQLEKARDLALVPVQKRISEREGRSREMRDRELCRFRAELRVDTYLGHIKTYLEREFDFDGEHQELSKEADRLREPVRKRLILQLIEEPIWNQTKSANG